MSDTSTIVPPTTNTGWIRTVSRRRHNTRRRKSSRKPSPPILTIPSRNLLLSSGSFSQKRLTDEAIEVPNEMQRDYVPTTKEVGIVVPNFDSEGVSMTIKFKNKPSYYIVTEWPNDVRVGEHNLGYILEFPDGERANYTFGDTLGGGSFGDVELIIPPPDSRKPLFAIKTFRPPESGDNEVEWVTDKRVQSVMVPAKPYRVNSKNVVLMSVGEILDEPIKLKHPLTPVQVSVVSVMVDNIVKAILSMQRQLLQHGLLYSDLKLDNVLVVPERGGIRIMFTDYGGLCAYNGDCVHTFRPPEGGSQFRNITAAERAAMWWCGELGMSLWKMLFSKRYKDAYRYYADYPIRFKRLARTEAEKRDDLSDEEF
jgi:hypothetical protein